MILSDRAAAVLLACESIGQPWHQHYMSRVADALRETMTEAEVAAHFDDLIERGCIRSNGSLVYSLTPLGEAVCARWRKRGSTSDASHLPRG